MIANNTTCGSFPNGTSTCPTSPGSSAGLAAGLTIFFLLLLIVPGALIYKYHREIMTRLPIGHRRSQKKEDYPEPSEAVVRQYTSLRREQSTAQTPIYENLSTTRQNKSTASQNRSAGETEEDLYLQCDLPDDAIYSNDPACNLFILPDNQEEDVYIVPDS